MKALTKAEFEQRAKAVHGDRYGYSKSGFTKATAKVEIECRKHGPFSQKAYKHLSGQQCPKCHVEKLRASVRISPDEFMAQLSRVHGDRYAYHSDFTSMTDKIRVSCRLHGDFYQRAYAHVNGQGCPKCGRSRSGAKHRLTQAEFLREASSKHGDRYVYTNAKYESAMVPVLIGCREHGDFEQAPYLHALGHGCPVCGRNRQREKSALSQAVFEQRVAMKHGTGHRISDFSSIGKAVLVHCPKHGPQTRSAQSLLRSSIVCLACAQEAKTDGKAARLATRKAEAKSPVSAARLVARAKVAHGNRYDYSRLVHAGVKQKAQIGCPKHGFFTQMVENHVLRKSGCPRCANQLSSGEVAVAEWMQSLGVTVERRNRRIIPPREIDIYVPDSRLGFEFNGAYWHSQPFEATPSTKDHAKWQSCCRAGVQLFYIWDFDWNARPDVVKHWLACALGRGASLGNANAFSIADISGTEVNAFYARYHLLGPIEAAHGTHAALVRAGETVAAMTLSRASAEHFTFERFAAVGTVTGAADALFGHLIDRAGANYVTAHQDPAWDSESSYQQLGFHRTAASVSPDYRVWHTRLGVRSKAAWQQQALVERLTELGKADFDYTPSDAPGTEARVCQALGCRKIYDLGRVVWAWDRSTL